MRHADGHASLLCVILVHMLLVEKTQ
jgi:hypothetical protein